MKSVVKNCSAFSLAELMIVVAILGILAALIIPEFQGHTQQAKEAAAKDNLRILRQAIEYYTIEHNGVPPGYPGGNDLLAPTSLHFYAHLTMASNTAHQTAPAGTPGYPYGPYLREIPDNPFNNFSLVYVVSNNDAFPAAAVAGDYGWIYQAKTKRICLNTDGTDTAGQAYLEY